MVPLFAAIDAQIVSRPVLHIAQIRPAAIVEYRSIAALAVCRSVSMLQGGGDINFVKKMSFRMIAQCHIQLRLPGPLHRATYSVRG